MIVWRVIRIVMVLPHLLLLLTACNSAPVEFSGNNEYIFTIALPSDEGNPPPQGSAKVYFTNNTWDVPISVRRSVRMLMRDYDFQLLDTWPLKLIEEYCVVIKTSAAEAEQLAADNRLLSIQKVNYFSTLKSRPPYDDDRLNLQMGENVSYLNQLHAWSTGSKVRVGIIDTPIDLKHPDLKHRFVSQQVFVSTPLNPKDYVHGTAVAGIIGAEAGNGVGVVGFAPDTELRSFAACHYREDWQYTVCNTFSLAKAIVAAASHDLDVINMSLAGPNDRLLSRLLDILIENGVIIVAPFHPTDPDSASFPASMPRVVGVRSPPDNRPETGSTLRINDEHFSTRSGGGYQFFYGSSMSAARVTALISLLLEKQPDLDERQSVRALAHIAKDCSSEAKADDSCALKFALSPDRLAVSMQASDE